MKTIGLASVEMKKIKRYLEDADHGSIIMYADIEKATNVKMDDAGKQKMRSALHSLDREYTCIRGKGIELSSPSNSSVILGSRTMRIDNAVKRGSKSVNRIAAAHLEDMDEDSKKYTLFLGGIFGAIAANARLARRELKEKEEKRKMFPPISN